MSGRLDTQSLVAFLALAETLSFRRAAETLRVSELSLSLTITELERHLGVRLFVRDTSTVSLAPAGEILLPRARRVIRLLEDAEGEMRRDDGKGDRP